ncbi:LexA-binding, inner membrane-associated putative hydrolase [anaerobic digester metagenome]
MIRIDRTLFCWPAEPVDVDSLTHAFAAALLAGALGLPALVPFAVLGSVIIDADALFARLSDPHPSLYLFTHGGIAHGIAGAAGMAVLAWAGFLVAGLAGFVPPALSSIPAPVAFGAVLAGAYLHLALDWLACPGLPLLAPFSDRKYTLGLLPGPSLVLFGLSTIVLLLLGTGATTVNTLLLPAIASVGAFFTVRLGSFVLAHHRLRAAGRLVPMVNPLRWLAIGETPGAWSVVEHRIGGGMALSETYPKYRGVPAGEVAAYISDPVARRVHYHSYAFTVECDGDAVVVADPVRESGLVRYPFDHVRARLPLVIPAGCPEDRP